MGIFDTVLVAEIAALTVVTMQAIKTFPKIKGSMIPPLSVAVGIVACLIWYLVMGNLDASRTPLNLDWANIYRGVFNGIAGAIAGNAGYNVQKFLPMKNILPTATELDESAVKEVVAKRELVAQAVSEGISPQEAKKAVGLSDKEPPPTSALDAVAPSQTEAVVEDVTEPSVVDVRSEQGEKRYG